MNILSRILVLFVLSIVLAFIGHVEELSFAAQRNPPDLDSSQVSPKGHKAPAGASQRVLAPKVTKTGQAPTAELKGAILRRPSLTAEDSPSKKGRRAIKAHKKVMPKAVVQPRTDLMYYGMLEDSQRYDPRPNPRLAGVPNPQSSDLTHDHFQELDRNQDGIIDPVERAFGRIDMDRDLHTRTLR